MFDLQDNTLYQKKKVAKLIFAVLTDKICVREALKLFPQKYKDRSIKAAYHALIHREADEDLRYSDILYKDEQDAYLELIANTLDEGKDLPKNIIKNYNKYYKDLLVYHSDFVKKVVIKLCNFLKIK